MSMTSKKIKIIRNKLDQIDNKLLLVIKKRTQLVNEVIKQKKTKKEIIDKKRINTILKIIKKQTQLVNEVIRQKKTKKEIVDKKRINTILKRIKAKSIKLKIDPMISINIWKTMIRSFIKYEYKNFKKK